MKFVAELNLSSSFRFGVSGLVSACAVLNVHIHGVSPAFLSLGMEARYLVHHLTTLQGIIKSFHISCCVSVLEWHIN